MLLLFHGENTYAAKRKIKGAIERFKDKAGDDSGLERIDGKEVAEKELISKLGAMPLFATSRLLIVTDLTKNKDISKDAFKRIAKTPDTTNVIFYEPNPDKRTTGWKQLKKIAKPAEFKPLSDRQLSSWVQTLVDERNGSISPANARYLIERAGKDQWLLENEIEKLTNYDADIDKEAIDSLVEPSLEESIFTLLDELIRGDFSSAINRYRTLRKMQTDPHYIMAMVGWQLRNLLTVAAAGRRSDKDIKSQAGMSPFVIRKTRGLLRSTSFKNLQQAQSLVIETDYSLKTEPGDVDQRVENLLHKITGVL